MLNGWLFRWCLISLAAVSVCPAVAMGETALPLRVTVRHGAARVHDLPEKTLAVARREVERVFAQAHVAISWRADDDATPEDVPSAWELTLVLLRGAGANAVFPAADDKGIVVLGRAAPSTGCAYVNYDATRRLAMSARINIGVLLGRVFAHELGHLLLRRSDHNEVGLMRAHVELHPGRYPEFTAKEMAAIRKALVDDVASVVAANR